jgi:hypothetical protein
VAKIRRIACVALSRIALQTLTSNRLFFDCCRISRAMLISVVTVIPILASVLSFVSRIVLVYTF